jgi:RHS repeat-associated protein
MPYRQRAAHRGEGTRGETRYAYDALNCMYDSSIQHAFSTYLFTGKERDSESGLDNFGARYFASSMGRFMTPDPQFTQIDRLVIPSASTSMHM